LKKLVVGLLIACGVGAFGANAAGATPRSSSASNTVAGGASTATQRDVFAVCGKLRVNGPPSRNEARTIAKDFKRIRIKAARTTLSQGFEDALSAKDRRKAYTAAFDWCEEHDAYRTTALTVAPRMDVVDATTATITGSTVPGATVSSSIGSLTAVADPAGAFSIGVSGLIDGENRINLTSNALNMYPSTAVVTVVKSESEAAFKASTGEIPYDELVKDPAALMGRRIHSRAKVFQYDARTGTTALLVSVTQKQPGRFEYWTDHALLQLPTSALGAGMDNNDIIEFWGTVSGPYSYDTAIGGKNTVPAVSVRYMNLLEKRES
jgi:hypothetical protein